MKELFVRLREFAAGLSPRERVLLGAVAAAFGAVLFWLLIVQPVDSAGSAAGAALLAADAAGAGAGETIFYVRGREAAHAFLPSHVPVDAAVVGIVDEAFVEPSCPPPGPDR